MIQLKRLGVVIAPADPEFRTEAKFNAGMAFDGDVVHMLYRHAIWKKNYDPDRESNYAIDEMCYARLTPTGVLIEDTNRAVLKPSLPWDSTGCQDARIVPFEGWFYLFYCGWERILPHLGRTVHVPLWLARVIS
jgi:predicted GH43/DUF377 family glycosyl hydrolase